MFAEFFTWWRQQLLDLVPEAWRRSAGEQANATVVDAAAPGVLTLLRRRRGVDGRTGTARLDEPGLLSLRAALAARPKGEPVLLRLAAGAALERQVFLPLAAERDPERVLGYDMERLTPFAAEEIFWGFAVEARDRARARLRLRLTVVPRASVQTLIDTLTGCGGRPSLIEAPTSGGVRAIRLNHADSGRGPRLSPRVMAATAGVLALAVVVSPFLRQSFELGDAQSRLDGLAPRIRLVDTIRNRIAGAGAGGDAVAGETRRLGDLLGALSAITEILPDDSYLTEFTMRERKITLAGLSASAPKLISALSSDPRVRNPAFTAPVTRNETGKNDVFAIRADWAE